MDYLGRTVHTYWKFVSWRTYDVYRHALDYARQKNTLYSQKLRMYLGPGASVRSEKVTLLSARDTRRGRTL